MKIHGYLHEVWLCPDDEGDLLPACIALGPAGDDARTLNDPWSVCVWVFWADSHFEAMSIFYNFANYGKYTTAQEWDYTRYPDDWYEEQLNYLRNLKSYNEVW